MEGWYSQKKVSSSLGEGKIKYPEEEKRLISLRQEKYIEEFDEDWAQLKSSLKDERLVDQQIEYIGSLGYILQIARLGKDLTGAQLASKIFTSKGTKMEAFMITRMENNCFRNVSVSILNQMVKVLELDRDYIFYLFGYIPNYLYEDIKDLDSNLSLSQFNDLKNKYTRKKTMYADKIRKFSEASSEEALPKKPQKLHKKDIQFLYDMVNEELQELKDAKDLGEQADALADAVYFVYYMAGKKGINLDRIMSIVHENNMSKVEGGKIVRGKDGKIGKPKGWKCPSLLIENEINRQIKEGSFGN